MIQKSVTVEEVVNILNGLLTLDRKAISELVAQRIECGPSLQLHGTIQITPDSKIGVLGLINGFFGKDEKGNGIIYAVVGDNNLIRYFAYRREVPINGSLQ